ncbi:MAG: hypothetical protein ACKOC5_11730, partial [Chloroflexota bacterium]
VYFGKLAPGPNLLTVKIPAVAACCGSTKRLNVRLRAYEGFSPPPVIAPGGIVLNGEVEDYQFSASSTAVDMASFTAAAQSHQVLVDWVTAMEEDAQGFNLYRSTTPGGERTQLNAELIPSQAVDRLNGASYRYIDTAVQPGTTYYYWLEFIDLDEPDIFGPIVIFMPYSIYMPTVHN